MTKLATISAVLILAGSLGLVRGTLEDSDLQADREAIVQLARDYIDGFCEASTERMERALHSDLANADIVTDRAPRAIPAGFTSNAAESSQHYSRA